MQGTDILIPEGLTIPRISVSEATREVYGHRDESGEPQCAILVDHLLSYPVIVSPAVWRANGSSQVDTLQAQDLRKWHFDDEFDRLLRILADACRVSPGKDVQFSYKAKELQSNAPCQYTMLGRLVIVRNKPHRLMKFVSKEYI